MSNCTEYKEIVCRISEWQKNPCQQTNCKHHFCHVPHSQSGIEYEVENFPKQGKCPYGKKWIVGKGLAWRGCEVAE